MAGGAATGRPVYRRQRRVVGERGRLRQQAKNGDRVSTGFRVQEKTAALAGPPRGQEPPRRALLVAEGERFGRLCRTTVYTLLHGLGTCRRYEELNTVDTAVYNRAACVARVSGQTQPYKCRTCSASALHSSTPTCSGWPCALYVDTAVRALGHLASGPGGRGRDHPGHRWLGRAVLELRLAAGPLSLNPH